MTHRAEGTGSTIDQRDALLSFVAMAAIIVAALAMAAAKGGLHVNVYNPGGKALFAVSSSIVPRTD